MALEIKVNALQQRRQTFANVARRLGEDRPASRYEEAMYDLQPDINFHYRPTWDPTRELFDKSLTAIEMADWYELKDPRQFYYGTYTIARARMMEAVEKNFAFAEKRGLLSSFDADWHDMVRFYLIPLRHAEWGANMNACNITDLGYGAAITQPAMFATMDRLGIAQIISRIGLLMGGPAALDQAKQVWMAAPEWQPFRRLVEDTLVIDDWFEQFVAQFLSIDGLLYALVYDAFDAVGAQRGAGSLSIICEFMVDWQQETAKWVDAVIKRAAAESDQNRANLTKWQLKWEARAADALTPLAEKVLGADGVDTLATIRASLASRTTRIGIMANESIRA